MAVIMFPCSIEYHPCSLVSYGDVCIHIKSEQCVAMHLLTGRFHQPQQSGASPERFFGINLSALCVPHANLLSFDVQACCCVCAFLLLSYLFIILFFFFDSFKLCYV